MVETVKGYVEKRRRDLESLVGPNKIKKEFWKGKRVLLTGHTGFKGTWMSILLQVLGAEVCGFSLPLNASTFYSQVLPSIQSHNEGDIADTKKVLQLFDTFKPEIVIHLASHSSLDGSMKIPHFILQTNLMGVVNVLEATRKTDSVKSVVVVTSDKCYQNMETNEPYTEDAMLGGKDPYSTSKVCQELLSSCYMDTFFNDEIRPIGIATARASNVIGAGDYNISRLMPYLLDRYSNGRTPQIRNPYAVRPWQYVLDVLYGYLLLAEKLYESAGITTEFNGAYNFGPAADGFEQVGKIAEMVGKQFNSYEYIIKPGEDHIRKETKILKLDSTKAEKVLNWKIQKHLEETITLTVDFVKREQQGEATGFLCREQILRYMEGMN